MSKYIFVIFLTFFLSASAEFQTFCKNFNIQPGFNVSKLIGQWNLNQIAFSVSKFDMFEEQGQCFKIDFFDMFPGIDDTFGAYVHSPIFDDFPYGRSANMAGVTIPDLNLQARMKISNHYFGKYDPRMETSVHVLHTDYKTLLGLFCFYEKGSNGQEDYNEYWAAMLSKEEKLEESTFEAYKSLLSMNGIVHPFFEIDQNNCPNTSELLP